jgi:hypothetical protein
VLGYDERGHCPMLVDGGCSIYEHRPQTCRMYDCRVFTAAEIELAEPSKSEIAARARGWRFEFPTPADRTRHDAVRRAASFLRHDLVPRNATEAAVLAAELHDVFLERDAATGELTVGDPTPEAVQVEITRRTA